MWIIGECPGTSWLGLQADLSGITHCMMWLHVSYSQLEYRLRNDLYCVEWGVKLYSLTHRSQRNQWVWPDWTSKGQTLIPWQGGKPLTWDVTVVSTLAASYLSSSARSAGAAADLAASRRKEAKYTSLTNSYIFQPIAVESHGSCSASSLSFLTTIWANAWRAPPATCARCHISLYSVSIRS